MWHNIWKHCGEPKDGILYESKTKAHHQYMYATIRYKRRKVQLRNDRMTLYRLMQYVTPKEVETSLRRSRSLNQKSE